MTNWLNQFLAELSSVAVAAGIVAWIAKQAIGNLLKADLEQFKLDLKHSHDRDLAAYRQKLEVEATSDERVRREIVAWANPIQDAAVSLQMRLDNILRHEGYWALHPGYTDPDWSISYDYFLASTLYLFGQYFCWIQMLRLELSFELFRSQADKVALFQKIDAVSKALGDYDPGQKYTGSGNDTQVFRLQQRGIGELFAIRRDGKRACRGYAHFLSKLPDAEYQRLFEPVSRLVDRLQEKEKRWQRLEATLAALQALIAHCEAVLKLPEKK
jgi:hypothetical protein